MDAAKLECEHPSTLLHPACLFPWILGVFDTMAIVGNGCGKIRGGWEQPILAICLQYAGKRGADVNRKGIDDYVSQSKKISCK